MLRSIAFLLFVGLASACSRSCKQPAPAKDAGPESVEVSSRPPVMGPKWSELQDNAGFGLPSGCRLDSPIRRARVEKGARLASARHRLDAIAIGVGKDDVERAGLVDLRSGQVAALPWAKLDSPPVFENTKAGWFAAWTIDDPRRALGWSGGDRAKVLAEGDQLELVDVACDGQRCAALTSLARDTRSAGATLTTSDGKRLDIDAPKDEAWAPFSILAFDAQHIRVGLSSGRRAAIWEAKSDAPFVEQKVHATPHGVYGGAGNWIVAAGAPPDRPCGKEEFPIDILDAESSRRVRTPAPPEHLLVRSLGARVLVGWVARVSCQLLERRVIHLTLVTPGKSEPSSMAIADGAAFALASEGDRFSLWLLDEQGLVWISARCDPKA
jgi:hypothetical protein